MKGKLGKDCEGSTSRISETISKFDIRDCEDYYKH
jgi:hypothetical protein